MKYREAEVSDIYRLHEVRMSVRQNRLSNPQLIQIEDYVAFILNRGKGWVCETGTKIAGFAILDFSKNNVWALFVHPDWENKGIGSRLLSLMMDWHFSHCTESVWLSTEAGTKAEAFYRKKVGKKLGCMQIRKLNL